MNGPVPSSGWSARQWAVRILLVLAFQIVLVFLVAGPVPGSVQRVEPGTIYRFDFGDQAWDQTFSSDPTLFALAHPEGFSGSAWLEVSPPQFDVPDWNEPPVWLPLHGAALGEKFLHYAGSIEQPVFEIWGRAASQPGTLRLFLPEERPVRESRLVLSGALASRLEGDLPGLPVWNHPEPLARTGVEMAVDGRGEVIIARLVERSGFAEADRHALRAARSLPFQPRSANETHPTEGGWAWGGAWFLWKTGKEVDP
jgi:hypothetical protein